ncbi:uncharacterized protein LOC131940037 [Physella acuta]|uniref:uncharacterized protein LOC131940037 n=1 Tax=Physella acuta TaxID=109671 RepID=UPI0027DB9F2E|nr:uncharacterized protein LOC131940037 [Physella acuta]
MRVLIIACLAVVALTQSQTWLDRFREWFNVNKEDFTIDFVHNYRFEEHSTTGHHLLVAISDVTGDRSCHLIEVTPDWAPDLGDDTKMHIITDEIYKLITTHTLSETTLTYTDLRNVYGDSDALRECVQHRVYIVTYKPSYLTSG